jgi:hypothetical protein
MAWFNPPLYERGNRKCPNCGEPVKWMDGRRRSEGLEGWVCRKCQAPLAWDIGRVIARFTAFAAMAAVDALLWLDGTLASWEVAVASVITTSLMLWWFDSVVLRSPAEQAESESP